METGKVTCDPICARDQRPDAFKTVLWSVPDVHTMHRHEAEKRPGIED